MGKILIIDNRADANSLEYDTYKNVKLYTKYGNIRTEDPDQIDLIFVHASGNRVEHNWTLDHVDKKKKLYFVIAGDERNPRPTQYGQSGFRISREIFTQYIHKFLRHYSDTGRVQREIFWGAEPAMETAINGSPAGWRICALGGHEQFPELNRPAIVVEYVSIVEDVNKKLDRYASIKRIHEKVEHQQFDAIAFLSKYKNDLDGLQLAWLFRCSGFMTNCARMPILLITNQRADEIARSSAQGAQLFSIGNVLLVDALAVSSPGPLSDAQYALALQRASVPPPAASTPHDLTNMWGAYRAAAALESAVGNRKPLEVIESHFPHLLGDDYYWLQLCRAVCPNPTDKVNTALQQLRTAIGELSSFLDQVGHQLDVLLVDDHASSGWFTVISKMFSQKCNLIAISEKSKNFQLESAIATAVSHDNDLIISDLRLTNFDQSSTGRDGQPLSGIALVKQVKKHKPNVPVVIITASEKAWNSQLAIDAGADLYWIKENPQMVSNVSYPIENLNQLARGISILLKKKTDSSRLWRSYLKVKAVDCSCPIFGALQIHHSQTAIEESWKTMSLRLLRAYGYLDAPQTGFHNESFHQKNLDIAYLLIWSCINDLLKLLFTLKQDQYYFMTITGGYQWRHYCTRTQKANGKYEYTWEHPFKQALANSVNQTSCPAINRSTLESKYRPGITLGAEHLQAFLKFENQGILEDAFQACRTLRNALDIEHGDFQHAANATLGDINKMLDVIDYFIS